MPGLSQLKKFKSDLLSLGDEVTVRASRGEKPVDIAIPKEIEDKDDSEDFVLGMPEIEAEVDETLVDDDLSELTGIVQNSKNSDTKEEATPSFAAPDLSSLLSPMADDSNSNIPDLSMFDAPVEEENFEEIPEEPEEVAIADMGLEALLAGGGFDQEEEEESENFGRDEDAVIERASEDISPAKDFAPVEDLPLLDDLLGTEDSTLAEDLPSMEDLPGTEDITSAEDLLGLDGVAFSEDSLSSSSDVDLSDLGLEIEETNIDTSKELEREQSQKEESMKSDGYDYGFDSFDVPGFIDVNENDESAESSEKDFEDVSATDVDSITENSNLDSFNLDDLGDIEAFGKETDAENASGEDTAFAPEGLEDLSPLGDTGDLGDVGNEETAFAPEGLEDLSPLGDMGDLGDVSNEETAFAPEGLEDFGSLDDLGDLGDFGNIGETQTETTTEEDIPSSISDDLQIDATQLDDLKIDSTQLDDLQIDVPQSDDLQSDDLQSDDLQSDDLQSDDLQSDDLQSDDLQSDTTKIDDSQSDFSIDDDFSLPDTPGDLLEGIQMDLDIPGEDNSEKKSDENSLDDFSSMDFSAGDDIPDYSEDISEFDSSESEAESEDEGEGEDIGKESAPLEVFDTSEMEGLDFGIPDTDSKLGTGPDFELGGSDDFSMEGEFEIPGFSDVDTVKEEKSIPKTASTKNPSRLKGSKSKNLPEPDFSDAEESKELPPNTLSDAQYKKFRKNLSEYPLNVRLAFEDFIVQDEFTDDAEFEIIEKILNKAPARQIASMLEKMLDISIPVPRDFEHRTAEEYEAYKKSLSYQLRNKIIPGVLVAALLLLVGWGLFNFTRSCIYRPLVANKYYKQGYVLLEANEYPQSEISFNKAVSYRINKKWFFKYARGYRKHKQYQRSALMYEKILSYYKHNKEAGLEYADMELNDLANYERAEEIVRREVLDYHVNDADGILMLGDVFLEWGTEKDSSKLELAREQYATLLQLYKANDLYLSRMLRYFIRSDNLLEVLQLDQTFTKEKQLSSEDWTELSGYLLDKYYGPLAPSQEYLRYEIEGLRSKLTRAVKTNPNNPIALYNLSKYYVKTNETEFIENTLQKSIEKFNTVESIRRRDLYKYIDAYKLLGEHYVSTSDYLKAQEQFAEGISLYTTERDNAGFEGNVEIGKLYEDMGNIKYTISGDLDQALSNYKQSVALENDTPSIRYRIGYIQYKNKNYSEALGSFMKAGDGNVKGRNLLLAMANTLALRNDDYAAQGYYNQLIDTLDFEIAENGIVFPQANENDYDIVNTYLRAANNYGVTLYKLAKRTGNSALNAQSIVQFSQSVRAWDALTRNQTTMKRLEGSNLAEQNIKYITNPIPNFEPSIYIDISKTLTDKEKM